MASRGPASADDGSPIGSDDETTTAPSPTSRRRSCRTDSTVGKRFRPTAASRQVIEGSRNERDLTRRLLPKDPAPARTSAPGMTPVPRIIANALAGGLSAGSCWVRVRGSWASSRAPSQAGSRPDSCSDSRAAGLLLLGVGASLTAAQLAVRWHKPLCFIDLPRCANAGAITAGRCLKPKLRAPSASGGWLSSDHDLIRSSSSPAGESPVRVAARRPGSRLAARPGNGPGGSPASKAL